MINIDSFINNIALAMQFEFGSKLYFKLCNKCDNKVKHCCQLKSGELGGVEYLGTY